MWDLAGGPRAWNVQREEARLVEMETSNPRSHTWRMREGMGEMQPQKARWEGTRTMW